MAFSGTTMSEKKMAASTPCRRTGWSVISTTRSGVKQDSSIAVPSRTLRYSGSERPAWRMNQTGVCSTASPAGGAQEHGVGGPAGHQGVVRAEQRGGFGGVGGRAGQGCGHGLNRPTARRGSRGSRAAAGAGRRTGPSGHRSGTFGPRDGKLLVSRL